MNNRTTAFVVFIALFSCACAAPNSHEKQITHGSPLLSGLEIAPLEFKPGSPREGESIEQSLSEGFMAGLKDLLVILNNYPGMRYMLLGFTDDVECERARCDELSLRRAKMVHEWLIANGVPSGTLAPPRGQGSKMAIGNNETLLGRAANRRVELSYLPESYSR